jgi:uncharacterized protein YoxC
MDMDINTAVNVAVGVSLLILAIATALLTGSLMPLLRQVNSTAVSVQKLSDTLEREVQPTMLELRNVMEGVNQLKAITTQRVQDVSSKAGELTGNVSTMVTTAKKESTVASAGLLAGLRSYLFHHPDSHEPEKSQSKAITMTRDEKNV